MSTKALFGFHAVTVRLKTAPQSIGEIHLDATRRDAHVPWALVALGIGTLALRARKQA